MYVCLSACVRACLIERYTKKKKKHPTFEWEVVFLRKGAKNKKMKQYFAVREMLPNKM